jgi:hypothetical protein
MTCIQKLRVALTVIELQRELIQLTEKISYEVIHSGTCEKYNRIKKRLDGYNKLLEESFLE